MRALFIFLSFFWGLSVTAQKFELAFIKSFPLKADTYYGTDTFENFYFGVKNVLYKKTPTKTYQYNNLALGSIYSVSIYNPLEIAVFYKDFNTVVILDNTLNEIKKLMFLNKTITLVAKAGKNELWLYNADAQQLELYNYHTKKIIAKTQPNRILNPLKLKGNANYAWIQTKANQLDTYNNYGSLVNSYNLKFDDFNIIVNKTLLFNNTNSFYLADKKFKPALLKVAYNIKSTSFVDNKLYLFNNKQLFIYKLLKN